ncbi:MAG: carbon monoxide dehydrogenase [Rhodospirillaceae bacterium TMED8]|nr:carbon monoxide dehydrogenase [Magnetovibrio sp.]OUT53356.1 MAG: carbon monoxide dehydrogenase [Rhodospirillaceae bacterium TMED8]|tara:strand:+ start:3117 stop:3911 length:795 start_codon:yes stop_codon:yes gene_type:complete
MYDFTFHKPTKLDEAIALLKDADDGQAMAGGQTLIPVMKQRLTMPSDVIDLAGIKELQLISISSGIISIGAMVSHAVVARSHEIQSAIPALADLAGMIGDPHVRNRGTIGGAISNNDPAADYPAAVVGLNATIKTNKREIKADDFFLDIFETALEDNELVIEVNFPVPVAANYKKFPNPASRYALVGVMVSRGIDGVRVAVTGAGPSVFRALKMEAALNQSFAPQALEGLNIANDSLNTDLHASADYRAHLINVLTRRAVTAIA